MWQGLLEISGDGVMKLLTDEAEGLKFKQTNAVDVAVDGMIYFTDASYKYGLIEFIWEILEGRPHGRLLSFDPSTQETVVLLRDLYLANGVVVSPDQTSVVFCETLMYVSHSHVLTLIEALMCKRKWIKLIITSKITILELEHVYLSLNY